MRVLVCGGRDFDDYKLLNATLDALPPVTFLIHGAARGADVYAAQWAERQTSIIILGYPAQWNLFGRSAGVLRNEEMLKEGKPELVVAFWDGKSRGTMDMITRSIRAGVPVRVHPYGKRRAD